MQNITLQIPESELREVIEAYQVLQNFLARIVSPNDLYKSEFLQGLKQAQEEVAANDLVEVTDLAGFTQ